MIKIRVAPQIFRRNILNERREEIETALANIFFYSIDKYHLLAACRINARARVGYQSITFSLSCI